MTIYRLIEIEPGLGLLGEYPSAKKAEISKREVESRNPFVTLAIRRVEQVEPFSYKNFR